MNNREVDKYIYIIYYFTDYFMHIKYQKIAHCYVHFVGFFLLLFVHYLNLDNLHCDLIVFVISFSYYYYSMSDDLLIYYETTKLFIKCKFEIFMLF